MFGVLYNDPSVSGVCVRGLDERSGWGGGVWVRGLGKGSG